MQYEVEVQTTRSERRKVEAASLDEALDLAKAGEGESMNEGQVQVSMHGRLYEQRCMTATVIIGFSEES